MTKSEVIKKFKDMCKYLPDDDSILDIRFSITPDETLKTNLTFKELVNDKESKLTISEF